MTDYLYGGILVAEAAPFRRATNASCTIYDVTDTGNTAPLALKDPNGLPLPNPLTSSADAFLPPLIAPAEGIKIVGGGLTVVVYSHTGMQAAAAASAAAAQTAAANAASAASSALAGAVADASSAKAAAQAAAALVAAPADSAIAAAINGAGTATKAALSATYASYANLAKTPDSIIAGAVTMDASNQVTSAAVVWPDGTPGTLTITSRDSFGNVLAYNITYGSPVIKTFTQPTITRNSSGAATNVPQIVVS